MPVSTRRVTRAQGGLPPKAGTGEKSGKGGPHLVVFVHGLRGNPGQLHYLHDALKAQHPHLLLLLTESNKGKHTYDGIETGGERIAWEIEHALAEFEKAAKRIQQISIVGYSLGGLIARYAIGLLHFKGYFETIKPVNFVTFATPHLGVRTPLRGIVNHCWNVLGARTISASGRQLFTIDKFRDTGRPLLSVLADPESVFWRGLQLFDNRVLYANVVNDRSTAYFTSAISRTDPFASLPTSLSSTMPETLPITVHFLPGYEPIMIDPSAPITVNSAKNDGTIWSSAGKAAIATIKFPAIIIYALIVGIGTLLYIMNSLLQTLLSARRIRVHCKEGQRGYHALPLPVAAAAEATVKAVANEISASTIAKRQENGTTNGIIKSVRFKPEERFEPLALTPEQLEMIMHLDALGWRKFPAWIHRAKHAHAAIIVRKPGMEEWSEGKVVVSHWVKEGFIP